MQHALFGYLINAAWLAPLVAATAWTVLHLADLSPRTRNLAWLGFLALAVVAPALPGAGASRALAPAPRSDLAMPAALPAESETTLAANLSRVSPLSLTRVEFSPRAASLVKLAFVTVAAVGLARLALAMAASLRLVSRSRDIILASPVTSAVEAFARAHGGRVPPVRVCEDVSSPVVVGALRPVILIPGRFAALTEADQQAALLHECAHVVRRDYAVNLFSELVALPLSWHPALYPLKAGVRRSRELACDAMAAAAMTSERDYARRLLSLAKALGAPARAHGAPAMVGLFGKSSLEERLMHLTNPKGAQTPGLKAARMGGAAAVALLALTPAILFRVTPAFAEAAAPMAASAASTPTPAVAQAPMHAPAPMILAAQTASEPHPILAAPTPPAPPPAPAAPPAPPALPAPAPQPALPALPILPTLAAPAAPVHLAAVRACPDERERVRQTALNDARAPEEERADSGHRVRISPDGHHIDVETADGAPTVRDSEVEAAVHRALDRVAAAQHMVDSPEFKQRVARLAAQADERAKEAGERARQAGDRAQARIAEDAARTGRIEADRARREIERETRDLNHAAD
jgi:beta-lactamase regulating signal transducer with metallopeptidase domain